MEERVKAIDVGERVMRVSKRVLEEQASTRGARTEGVHLRGERVVTAYCARSVGPILEAMLGESGIENEGLSLPTSQ